MTKKFHIETFGCQMNELDSEKIAGNLQHRGMLPVRSREEADVIILNTCSIREKAVQKVYARLGEINKHKRQDVRVGVVGCMAQLEGEKILKRAPCVDLVAGPQKGPIMFDLIENASAGEAPVVDLRMDDDTDPLESVHVLRENPWRASVTISEGCDRQCSFCVVPFTRGKQRDRDSASILKEIEDLVQQGAVEIMLLGQTVNSYRDPSRPEIDFAALLRQAASIKGIKRIRFTSPHPSEFNDALLAVLISCPQVCSHLHLPVQSGSTRILQAMRRGYTRETYLEKIRKIQQAPRNISISTDIMVGFTGESEADFQDTLSLLDAVQYDCVFSFKYSLRPNTTAGAWDDDIPDAEKGRRLKILQGHQKLIQHNKNAGYLGQILDVLVDARARSRFKLAGRSSHNKVVNFDGPDELMGRIVSVQVTGFSANSLKGVWIGPSPEEE
jgi:tRNA-2-methylthio-N6-dimethylallyladenosine synthase